MTIIVVSSLLIVLPFGQYDVREDGSVKDDLVLGVRSVLGHVSGNAIDYRCAAAT